MDLLALRALLTLDKDQYEEGLDDAEQKAEGFGSKFKDIMGKAAKAGAAAMVASASAVALLGKSSIQAYAETEQLVGGVRKLYGNAGMSVEEYAASVGKSVDQVNADWKRNEQAQEEVLKNARQAFKTSGMSYNEYMEQATNFSAALINSLDGDTMAAAKQTDVAMRAIADNYNTFGGDMQNIQYAFQGFAKQNYTMLDNLKLGYGGTKSEMQRLIDDANKWAEENGKAADLSIDSFSDVVTAIDYIQQKQGIAGTTAKEAGTTIAGSIGMVKAAYANLIAGLADPDADISQLVTDLVDSVTVAGENLMPAVTKFAEGFATALSQLAPTIVKGIPDMLSTMLPILIESATQMLGVLFQTIQTAVPELMNIGQEIVQKLADGVGQNAGKFIESGMNMLVKFSEFIRNSAANLIPVALTLIQNLANGIIQNIPTFIQTIPVIISNFANVINDNAPKILETGMNIIVHLISGIIKGIPTLIANLPAIITAIVDVIKAVSWVSLGRLAMNGISKGISAAGGLIKSAITKPIGAAKAAIIAGFGAAKDKAVGYISSLKDSAKKKLDDAKSAIKKIVDKIKGFFPLSIGKIFTGIKLPHIKFSGGKAPYGLLGKGSAPKPSVSWYKKAYENPYIFDRPTVPGFGDGVGSELVYGKTALMSDITEAMQKGGGKTVNIHNVITVNGAEDPEAYMKKFVRSMEVQMRTA